MLAKSKFFNKNQPSNSTSNSNNWLYTQVSKGNIKKIIKIQNAFLKLSFNKVMEIYNIMMSYTSPSIWELHPCSDIISQWYKPTSHGSATTI